MSLEYRLWQLLYQDGWSYSEEAVALDPVTSQGTPANTYGYTNSYPWVFWNAAVKNPSREHITVYRNGVPLSPTSYDVDFINGKIRFKSTVTGNITADISHFTGHVIEGYPDEDTLKMLDLPIIAYDVEGKKGRPFMIGGSNREYTFPIAIDILAQDKGQVKDLMDSVVNMLLQVPYLDMEGAWLLTKDGDVDSNFNFDLQFQKYLNLGRDPNGSLLKPRTGGSDKEKFRALVESEVKIIS